MMYKKVSLAETKEDLKNIQIEMINRFGLLPAELRNFFLQAELKIIAETCSIRQINFLKDKVKISFKNEQLDTAFFADGELEEKVEITKNVIQTIYKNAS